MLLLYCTVNPLIAPSETGLFLRKSAQVTPPEMDVSTGRISKQREPPSGVGVPSRPLRFSFWRVPLAEIIQNANSFRGTPEQLAPNRLVKRCCRRLGSA